LNKTRERFGSVMAAGVLQVQLTAMPAAFTSAAANIV
jgi:hypothetical protein